MIDAAATATDDEGDAHKLPYIEGFSCSVFRVDPFRVRVPPAAVYRFEMVVR